MIISLRSVVAGSVKECRSSKALEVGTVSSEMIIKKPERPTEERCKLREMR